MPKLLIGLVLLLLCSFWANGQSIEKQLTDSLALAKDDSTKIRLLIKLAKKVAVRSPDSAMQLANRAMLAASRNENEKDIGRVYMLIGRIYYDQGKFLLAIENFKSSFAHVAKVNDSVRMSSALNDIGRANRRLGDSREAYDYYLKGLDMAGDDKEMIGVISNNLAMVLNDIGDDSLALTYYQKSLSIAKERKDTLGVILSLNNMGTQYHRLKDVKNEEQCFLKALELTEKSYKTEVYGLTYDNIGTMWEDRGDFQKALGYYLKELEYEKKSGVKVYIAEALSSISKIYLKMKDYQNSLKYASEGYAMSEQIQSAELKAASAKNLAEVLEKLKRFEQSLYFTKIAHTISDSLNSIERAKTISNMASRYELAKKEVEIKSLHLEKQIQKTALQQQSQLRNGLIAFLTIVTIILGYTFYLYRARKKANEMLVVWSNEVDRKNKELDNLNRVKDKIFSSIAHDVRSPLASIQGVLLLMTKNILSPEEVHKITIELSARVNTTSALLENLLNWSKNQIATAKANPVKTDIKNLVDECMVLYGNNAMEKNITLANHITESSFVFADEEMIRITLRNLISNAIKFTQPDGQVKIEATIEERNLCISVADSGVGIAQEDIDKIFSLAAYTTPGTAREKGTGLGLILCKEFIEKNGGDIRVESCYGKGSTFRFTIPAA